MSKFEWKDLPNWEDDTEYEYLYDLNREEWAWELLRRNMRYRQAYKKLEKWKAEIGSDWQKHPSSVVYRPRKTNGESDEVWRKRIAMESGVLPRPIPVDTYLKKIWGLDNLYNPSQQKFGWTIGSEVIIFPRMINIPDQLDEFIVEDTTTGISHIDYEYAIVVYDITKPITRQTEDADKLVKNWQKKLVGEKIETQKKASSKSKTLIRSVRVMDALRSESPPTIKEIAIKFAPNGEPDCGYDRQGKKMIKSAKKAVRNYKQILTFSGTLPNK